MKRSEEERIQEKSQMSMENTDLKAQLNSLKHEIQKLNFEKDETSIDCGNNDC